MRTVVIICCFWMQIISVVMAIKLIKDKKTVKNPYLILAIVTFLVALWLICKLFGVFS